MRSVSFLLLLSIISSVISWSPTGSLAPGIVSCPNKTLIRAANGISEEEKTWLEGRDRVTNANLIKFLESKLENFDASNFVENASRPIRLAIGVSGGGWRAALVSAGQLAAFDDRTRGDSGLAGILQSATYLSGLSGGNWLTGTLAMNNFTSIQQILDEGEIWNLESSALNPQWDLNYTAEYYKTIRQDLDDKKKAGFPVTTSDTWGRVTSYTAFAKMKDHGVSMCFSDLQNFDVFKNHEMPMPFSLIINREPNSFIVGKNATVLEVNPFEFGSWDPSLRQFTPIKYLGTELDDGVDNGTCVAGFDNAGYLMGTSSSLYNLYHDFLDNLNLTAIPESVRETAKSLFKYAYDKETQYAFLEPNPFYNSHLGYAEDIVKNETLFMADGGEDGESIPFHPLIQPSRGVDVVFGLDNGQDRPEGWPNGTTLINTFERQFSKQGTGKFPYVPDQQTLLNLNMTAKPAFFGCDAKNLTSISEKGHDVPLVIYLANRPFSFWSNTTVMKLNFQEWEKRGMIQNGYETATRLNGTLDSDWPTCVACAIIRREQERQGIEQSDQCKECFEEYCWNGEINHNSIAGVNFTDIGLTSGPNDSGNRKVIEPSNQIY